MKRALLIVDVQKDFLPGGALPVAEGDAVVPIINHLMNKHFDLIVATKDWHPSHHSSFANSGGLWPVHCVQYSEGAAFSGELNTGKIKKVFYKGTDPDIDSYSAFFDNNHHLSTGLGEYLQEQDIAEVYVAGLATDYCVKYTVLDALNLKFSVFVVEDACRGVNLNPKDSQEALHDIQQQGARLILSEEIV